MSSVSQVSFEIILTSRRNTTMRERTLVSLLAYAMAGFDVPVKDRAKRKTAVTCLAFERLKVYVLVFTSRSQSSEPER